MPKKRKSVFVTVGTTQFDSLIEALDTPECADALRGNGYGSVVIQRGKGTRELVHLAPRRRRRSRAAAGENARGGAGGGAGRSDRGLEPEPLEVRVFDFAPSLADEMLAADLVVSHAGSGSVFEALGMRKPLLVVVNDALMDNHQAELAEELGKRGTCGGANPAGWRRDRDVRPAGVDAVRAGGSERHSEGARRRARVTRAVLRNERDKRE